MYHYTKLSLLAIAIAMTGTATYTVKAHIQNDALAVTQAKIPLTQAITAAGQHANGKTSHAEYEQSKRGWMYDVEAVNGTKVFDVRIDADKGTIISAVKDKADHDDVHDKRDWLRTATLGLCRD